MKNEENGYYIYIRSTGERVSVTKEEFDNYYRDINTFRYKQQRHGKCVCPKSKRLSCDMDCWSCPFRRAGDTVSLDYENSDDDESSHEIYTPKDESPLVEDAILEIDEAKRLYSRLCELIPEAGTIAELRLEGYSFLQISELLGVKNTTLSMRLKTAKNKLSEEFPDFF